jgi:hypothetical protein
MNIFHRIALRLLAPSLLRSVQLELAKAKASNQQWQLLTSDILSTFQENKDFIVTQERVECWRHEWSKLSGLNYNDVH